MLVRGWTTSWGPARVARGAGIGTQPLSNYGPGARPELADSRPGTSTLGHKPPPRRAVRPSSVDCTLRPGAASDCTATATTPTPRPHPRVAAVTGDWCQYPGASAASRSAPCGPSGPDPGRPASLPRNPTVDLVSSRSEGDDSPPVPSTGRGEHGALKMVARAASTCGGDMVAQPATTFKFTTRRVRSPTLSCDSSSGSHGDENSGLGASRSRQPVPDRLQPERSYATTTRPTWRSTGSRSKSTSRARNALKFRRRG
jgi:hypothetical protein